MNGLKTESLLGIDVGTTSTKAVLFDLEGQELARAVSNAYHNLTPQPGWVEQDPEEIWNAVLSVIKQIVDHVGDQTHIKAISIAVQSGSLLPANKSGEPVYPILSYEWDASQKYPILISPLVDSYNFV